jgi:maleamate amidohydrolase
VSDDLTSNYAGAFTGHLSPGERPALLIVDAVQAYLDPASPLYAGVETALGSIERLLDGARRCNAPVLFTNVVYREDGRDGGLFFKKVPALRSFVAGSPLGTFPSSITPRADEIVLSKQYPSAFFGTPLASMLVEMGVDTLIIVGFSTSGCVRATALDALCYGFVPLVVRDACGDRHAAPHEANLFDLQAKYAEVVDEAWALQFLAAALGEPPRNA